MKTRTFILTFLMMVCSSVFGQNHWNFNPYDYPENYGIVTTVKIDGTEQQAVGTIEVGAFCGDVVRGSAKIEKHNVIGNFIARLQVYGNTNDVITFKIYNHETGTEYVLSSTETLVLSNTMSDYTAVAPYAIEFNSVAQVESVVYETLPAAIEAAQAGQTITMLQDVALTASFNINKNIVLDLNGKKISSTVTRAIHVANASLTINDVAENSGMVTTTGNAALLVGENATLVVNGGTIKAQGAIMGNGQYNGTNITINGGIIDGDGEIAIYHPQNGTLYIKGGVITGGTGVEMRAGTLNMSAGTIEATDAFATRKHDSGQTVEGAAIALSQHNTNHPVAINVTGGTIKAIGVNGKAFYQDRLTTVYTPSTNISATIAAGVIVTGAVEAAELGFNIVENNGAYTLEYVGVVAQIGDVKYESLDEAFAAAQDGNEVKILKAGTYALSTSGKNITITGAVEGVVFDNIGAKNMGSANVTFNNVTFDYYPNVNYTGLQHSGNLVYNNCTINGQVFLYGTSETFSNCTFNQNSADAYNVWTYGAKDVDFIECTFNSVGKSVLIYNESESVTNDVTVTDCDFIASAPVDGKAAIEMDSSLQGEIKLTVDAATTATGFGTGNVSGNSLWNNKKGNETEANNDITVIVKGETVLAPLPLVAMTADDKNHRFTSLQAAYNNVAAAGTITILNSFEGPGLVINKNVTIDFNGNTYTVNEGVGSTGTETNGLQILNGNTVVLNNGTLNVAESAKANFYILVQNYANLTVDGMKLDGTNLDKYSGTDGDSYALSNNSGTVEIKGATEIIANDEGDKAFAFDVCKYANYAAPVVNVTGAEVKVNGAIEVHQDIPNNLNISAGTFTTEIKEAWCAEGYIPTQNTDGTWTVKAGKYVAQINDGAKYETLAEALAAAQDGNTVNLLADMANIGSVTFSKSLTINGNGHTISGESRIVVACGHNTVTGVSSTFNNIIFKDITPNKSWSAIVVNHLDAKLTVNGCTFDNVEWDAIQVASNKTNAEVSIINNTFRNGGKRYIHVQPTTDTKAKMDITVTGNKFYGENTTSIGIWYPTQTSTLNIEKNYVQYPSTISISLLDAENNIVNNSEKALPLYNESLTEEIRIEAVVKEGLYDAYFYAKFAEAVVKANDGAIINVLPLEITDYIVRNVDKETASLTILGASEWMGEGEVTTLKGGMYLGYNNSQCDPNTIVVKGITFEGKGLKIASQENVTVENNIFNNITDDRAIAVIGKNIKAVANNNTINNAAEIGIELRNMAEATITNNVVKNTGHNSVQATAVNADANVTIKGNTFENWGTATNAQGQLEGRAVRVSGGANVVVNNNKMINANAPESFVKITKVSGQTAQAIDVDKNYWNGDNPLALFETDGTNDPVSYIKGYYSDADLTNYIPLTASVAKVGDEYYQTLPAAVEAAQVGQTVNVLRDATGAGVKIDKDVTIDFNGNTYTVNEGVGSTGTETNGLQILNGNTVVLKNGTLNVAETAKADFYILVQNYANLTVDGMKLDGTNLDKYSGTDGDSYALSNNSGTVEIKGATEIIANDQGDKAFAFDVCKYANYAAPVVNVTGAEVKVNGAIEVHQDIPNNLNISAGTFTTEIKEAWCAEGYIPTQNTDGTWTVKAGKYVAQINDGAKYESLADATSAAVTGDVVKLLCSVNANEVTVDLNAAKKITIDLGGYTYTSTGTAFIAFRAGTELTITNGVVNGNGASGGTLRSTFNATLILGKNLTVNAGPQATAIVIQDAKFYVNPNTENVIVNGGIDCIKVQDNALEVSIASGTYIEDVQEWCAEGYVSESNGNGTWTVRKADYVAQIGTVKYETLQAAIDAAVDGNEIVVLKDINVGKDNTVLVDGYNTFFKLSGNKAVTIELNGKDIIGDVTGVDNIGGFGLVALLSICEGGQLTINDAVGTSDVKIANADINGNENVYSLISCYDNGNGSKLTINGGNYYLNKAVDCLIHSAGDEAVTVNGGTFTLANVGEEGPSQNYNPWIFNVNGGNAGNVTVNGGTYNSDINHLFWANEVYIPKTLALNYNASAGTWTVVESVAYVGETALSQNASERNVGYATIEEAIDAISNKKEYVGTTNETVTMLKDVTVNAPIIVESDVNFNLNGKTVTAVEDPAVYPVIRIQNGADVTIAGEGSIINNADYVFVLGASDGTSVGNLTIENGTFHGATTVASVTKGLLTITGGDFSVEPYQGNNYAYLINCIDSYYNSGDAEVSISGGTFHNWNPQNNAAEGANTNFCADGYGAITNDNATWTVIKALKRNLNEGWNWFSSYMVADAEDVQEALGENGLQIKSQLGFSQYIEYNGMKFWDGTITENPSVGMYMIKTSQAHEMTLVGNHVDPSQTPITIHPDWTWIAYPMTVETNISDAINFIPEVGDQIKGRSGFAYYMSNGEWQGEINTLVPGQGYMYHSKANVEKELIYGQTGSRSALKSNVTSENNHWVADAYQYANNMTMLATVDVEGGDYEVAAFVNGEVRGSSRPIYVESLDTYMLFLTIHGDEVEEMTFKMYDLTTGEEYAFDNRITYSDNAIVGSIEEPYMLTCATLGIGESTMSEINIYPNPTTIGREINLEATCEMVEVFNALGVKVAEYQNVDTIDAFETAGIYVIRLTNNGYVKHCRLVVK